jgi:RNA polymerase sigma-70 factor, ECF subfamily
MTARAEQPTESALLAAQFEQQRSLLFGIAYRMLGSGAEAEDVVQDAFLRFQGAGHVENPRAFLSTTVSRLCLDRLKSARARREQYIGPWLPEPVITAAQDPCCTPGHRLELEESVTTAFLLLLESLSPLERAVFLLHEVFDYDYREIAAMVGQKEDACRQHVHRARARLHDERRRFQVEPQEGQRIAESFVRAATTGDLAGLMRLVAPDVVAISDGGGKASAATKPVVGADRVTRLIDGLVRKFCLVEGMAISVTRANHMPAIVARYHGSVEFVTTLVIEDEQIVAIHVIRNPEKLARI